MVKFLIMKYDFTTLLKNMCCSKCKADFDKNSVEIIREEKNLLVINLTCQNCGKEFGTAFLSINNDQKATSQKDLELVIQDKNPAITVDDVIDAHNFIKDMSEDWQKYLPSEE